MKATKTQKEKVAVCTIKVPAVLSPTGKEIQVGDKFFYTKRKSSNGEGWLINIEGQKVPDIFFD